MRAHGQTADPDTARVLNEHPELRGFLAALSRHNAQNPVSRALARLQADPERYRNSVQGARDAMSLSDVAQAAALARAAEPETDTTRGRRVAARERRDRLDLAQGQRVLARGFGFVLRHLAAAARIVQLARLAPVLRWARRAIWRPLTAAQAVLGRALAAGWRLLLAGGRRAGRLLRAGLRALARRRPPRTLGPPCSRAGFPAGRGPRAVLPAGAQWRRGRGPALPRAGIRPAPGPTSVRIRCGRPPEVRAA